MNHAASLKIDDLVWEKMYVVFGKTEKKEAALNAIAVHCVFKINASFYLFAFLLFTCFLSRLLQASPEPRPSHVKVRVSKIKYSTIVSLICLLQSQHIKSNDLKPIWTHGLRRVTAWTRKGF